MQPRFKIGDKVKMLSNLYRWEEDYVPQGTVLTIVEDREDTSFFCSFKGMTIELEGVVGSPECFELVREYPSTEEVTTESVDSTIARPILEERKKDKVRIELFDDGFPNAIMEIAEVMSWANKHKGYKDGDWKNLPDAENALKGAASRHRVKANIQKEAGVLAKDRVDEESHIHHLAHQAFNVLAELELILTGKIK